jgi:tetratricopeptide (TPR) repeat protein
MTEQRLDHIQARLLEANLRRRHRFLYAQRHAQHLAGIPENAHAPDIFSQRHPMIIYQVLVMILLHIALFFKSMWLAHLLYFRSFSQITGPPLSYSELILGRSQEEGTVATRVTNLRGMRKGQTPSAGALSSMSVSASRVEWPNPPKIREDAIAFRCPCCCQTLPRSSHATKQWVYVWPCSIQLMSISRNLMLTSTSKHLDEDLRPFTCTIPNCAKAMTLFALKDDWQKHILEDHVSEEYWICPLCPRVQYHESRPFANAAHFPDRAIFESHLLETHKGAMSANLCSTLIKTSKRSAPVNLDGCPMCHVSDGPIKLDKQALLDHIAVELRELALRSLPWYDTSPETKNSVNAAGADADIRKWLDGIERPEDGRNSPVVEYKATRAAPTNENLRARLSTQEDIERGTRFLRHVEGSEGFSGLLHHVSSPDKANQYYDSNVYFATEEIRSNRADNPFEQSLSERSCGSSSEGTPDPVPSTLEDEVEQAYQHELAEKEEALGPDHPSTLDTVDHLSKLYRRQRLDEAEQMYQRALIGKEKALGPDHPSTLDVVYNLGEIYRDQGRLEEAEQMYRRALAGKEKALGHNHPSVLDIAYNLGNLYRDQGRSEEASKMYQHFLAGKEKRLGPDHQSTQDTVFNQGEVYRDQGRQDEAERMSERALFRRESVAEVVGFISATSTIMEACQRLYDTCRDAGYLPEAIRVAARKIPLILDVLGTFQQQMHKGDPSKGTGRAELEQYLQLAKKIMQGCKEKAEALHETFEKGLPRGSDSLGQRNRKLFMTTLVRKRKVEDLMRGILEDLQILPTSLFFRIREDPVFDITPAIDELAGLEPSLPDDDDDNNDGRLIYHHQGDLTTHAGGAFDDTDDRGGASSKPYNDDDQTTSWKMKTKRKTT